MHDKIAEAIDTAIKVYLRTGLYVGRENASLSDEEFKKFVKSYIEEQT